MGGIIMGALGGLGEQAANLGGTMFKAELDRDARQQESDLALSRAKALEEFKVGLGNAERAAQTARIDTAAQGIIGSKLADKANKLYGDKSNLTVDDLADEEKQALALTDGEKAAARTQAAINTGDISPKDAATLGVKDDALLYKAMWEQSKEEGRNARSDARITAQQEASDKRLAYLFASLEARDKKKGSADTAKEALQFLEGSRKQIQSEEQNLRQLYQAQIKDASKSERAKLDAEYLPKFTEITKKRADIEEDYNSMRERVGLPARSAAPTPAPPAPAPMPKPAASGTRPPLSSFQK